MAKFRTPQNRVSSRTNSQLIIQVCLIKNIPTLRCVVIGTQVYTRFVSVDSSRNKVLVEPIIVAEQGAISDVEISGLMFEHR